MAVHERDPLLPDSAEDGHEGEVHDMSKWQGDLDYAGMTWWTRPSVFWLLLPFFLYTLAFGGVIVPKLDLYLTLICRARLAQRAQDDPSFTFVPMAPFDENPECKTASMSALATEFSMACTLIPGILSVVTAPRLGALSDRYGRTTLLCVTTIGGILAEIVTIICAQFPDTVDYHFLLLGATFDGLAGSFIAGMAITHSYATDCTPPTKRAVAFGYFHACLFTGVAFGPLLAGIIIKATGTILIMFYLAAIAHTIFLLCLAFLIPESLTKKRQEMARERHIREREASQAKLGSTGAFLQRNINVLAPLKILYPTGEGSSTQIRTNLILLSAVDTIIFGTAMGAMTVVVYYSKYIFKWGSYESNMFVAIMNSCRVSALIIVLPGLNYLVRTRRRNRVRRESGIELVEKQSGSDNLDLYTIRASVLFEVLGYGGYALAMTGGLFTLGGVFASFGGVGSPTLQSALTKHVPQDRVGALLGATGLLHALARIVCPLTFGLIYAKTVTTLPNAVFVVLTTCFAVAFVTSWFIRPHIYLDADDLPASDNAVDQARDEREANRNLDEGVANV